MILRVFFEKIWFVGVQVFHFNLDVSSCTIQFIFGWLFI